MIDLHCDTLLRCYMNRDHSLRSNSGHVDLLRLRQGGITAQCFAIYVPSHENAAAKGIRVSPWDFYKACRDIFYAEIKKNTDLAAPAFTAADVERNEKAGKISAILTVEDCVELDGQIERLDELYRDGVRMATLTWNYENTLGYPHSSDTSRGLKEFGFLALEKMNALGMVADVSHLSDEGFWDVIHHSQKPFAASHSCARALCAHSRNLSDGQLRAMGERGCVVGVNFNADFLRSGSLLSTTEDILRHVEHVIQVAGEDSPALGSDFDGIGCGLEIRDCTGMQSLREALHKRFGYRLTEKVCRLNALRLFHDVTGS